MSKLTALMKSGLLLFSTCWVTLFGCLRWQPPAWISTFCSKLQQLWRICRGAPRKSLALLGALLLFTAAGGYAYHAWQNRPQSVKIDFTVTAPERTAIENEAKPSPLVINFEASVAPLALVDKDVTQGITLTPAIAGTWHWTDDKTLMFRPQTDWPVSSSHHVSFAPALVAEHLVLARDEFSFDTAKFSVSIEKNEFYQDPVDPALKKAVFQLGFTHPVDTERLAKQLRLQLHNAATPDKDVQDLRFTISYDKLKLHAYIHSQTLAIPRQNQTVSLTLAQGIAAANSDARATEALSATVDVPGLYTGLTIGDVQLTVASNQKTQTQDQVLVINTGLAVHEQLMSKAVTVWELPEFPPNPDVDRSTPYQWGVSEVTEAVLKDSKPLVVQALPAEQDYTQLHSFKVQATIKRSLYIKVAKDLKAFGGYLLADDFVQTLVVPQFPKELHIMGEGSLLALSGEKKLAVMTRNMPGLNVELGRVLPDQLHHLISQSDGTFGHPEFLGSFGQDNLAERFEMKIPLPVVAEGKPQYQSVDLSNYLLDAQGQHKRGVFLVTAKNYDPAQDKGNAADGETNGDDTSDDTDEGVAEAEDGAVVEDKRLIIVTDLGIIAKTEQSGAQVVFVQSIQNGSPQVGAEVELIGKNGQSLMRGTTDNDGKVRFAKLSRPERERAPMFYLVRYQGDMSFLPLERSDRQLDFSRFDIGGAANPTDANQLDAFLFSDRGIYRPGDTLHIGLIVRTAGWNMPLVGMPLEAEILDARDMVVKRIKLNLAEGGFNELSYTTLESSPTGKYTVNLYTVKDEAADQLLGSTSVKVEEFQPDRMKVATSFSSSVSEGGWAHPKDLKALVNVQNLYGLPAENRQVQAQLSLKPILPEFKRYRSYRFYDPHYAKEGVTETLTAMQTDSTGNAAFNLGLEKYQQASYWLNFSAQAYEAQGGRSVASEASILVSDLPYLVGYKLDGALSFVAKDAQRKVHFIAIDPQLQLTQADNLSLELIERKVLSVLKQQDDGTYRYESRPKEISLSKTPLSLSKAGFDLLLDTKNPGDYSYLVRDAQGLLLSKVEYSVAGDGNVSRSLDRNAELQMTLDKAEYEPGDSITLNIRAPYTGAGLITIERDKVYASTWFKASTQASVQRITVPKDLLGNGYVSVQFVREPSSDEIFMSPLSYGVAGFKVSEKSHTQTLNLIVPEQLKPGQTLNMHLTSAEPTKVVVFAVDEGILQVARYQQPKPLDYFFQKRQLSVDTTQILDLILPEFKKLLQLSAAGGDGEDDQAGSLLNPFKRKHDKPAVYWSGIVDLKGETDLTYQVPETFNGSLRVMAVAVNEQRIASVVQKTVVRDDLIVTPNVPFMVAPGDEFSVSVAIANNLKGSGKQAPVQVKLTTPAALSLLDASEKSLQIDEAHEGVTQFRLKVQDAATVALGNAALVFEVNSGTTHSTMHANLSVRPATPRMSKLRIGHFTQHIDVPIERQLFAEQRKVSAGLSPLPLVAVSGLTDYLDNFNHSCTEQLISKAIPTLVLGKHPEFANATTPQNTEETLLTMLSVLRSRQNAQGGFGLWGATPQAHEFASVYALHFLLDAAENQQPIPDDMLQKALDYAQGLAASPATDLAGIRTRAYAAYLLTRQGIVTTSSLASIREALMKGYAADEWQHDLATLYLAASYRLLQQQGLADELIQMALKNLATPSKTYSYAQYYDPVIYNAQALYLLARHFPAQAQKLPPAMLQNMAQAMQDQHYNTLSSAYFLLAYQAYVNAVPPETAAQLSIIATSNNGQTHALPLSPSFAPRASFPLDTQRLRFEGPSSLPLYYAISESGFDLQPLTQAVRNGMEIQRSYLNAAGKAVEQVALGETVTVQIRLRALGKDWIDNVAVQDILPAGFEAVIPTQTVMSNSNPESRVAEESPEENLPAWRDRLTTGGNWRTDYVDIREDRVLLYGAVRNDVAEYRYQVKATAAGVFTVPPIFAQSMYEPLLQATSEARKMQVDAASTH